MQRFNRNAWLVPSGNLQSQVIAAAKHGPYGKIERAMTTKLRNPTSLIWKSRWGDSENELPLSEKCCEIISFTVHSTE